MTADDALGKIVNGIVVVTARTPEKAGGMTAAWFTRVSSRPPLVMVSVGHGRFTHGLIRKSRSFCLNILADDQVPMAKKFGFVSGRNVDKFEGVPHRTAKTGSPVIEGAAGWLDCRLVGEAEAGDHTIFIGEVVDAGCSKKTPLVSRTEDYV
jgi:flavin reductase (DIM6/NTAB) family NADH-FMN oxidoreductase RutF